MRISTWKRILEGKGDKIMPYKDKTNAEYMREYRAKNPEKIKLWPSSLDKLEQMAKYRLKNRTHINQRARLKNITDRQESVRLAEKMTLYTFKLTILIMMVILKNVA